MCLPVAPPAGGVRWQPDVLMEPDSWVEIDASQLIFNRGLSVAILPALYLYRQSHAGDSGA